MNTEMQELLEAAEGALEHIKTTSGEYGDYNNDDAIATYWRLSNAIEAVKILLKTEATL